jgi:hypothetical protein
MTYDADRRQNRSRFTAPIAQSRFREDNLLEKGFVVMSVERFLIEVPFKSMTRAGWLDDVAKELNALAEDYAREYLDTLGDATDLTAEVFLDAVFNNFNREEAHAALAKEMVGAINAAAIRYLGEELDARFESLVAPRKDDGWRVTASVRVTTLTSPAGGASLAPRALYDTIAARLADAGCDEERFFDEFFSSAEIYYAASVGLDWEAFMNDIVKGAHAVDGHFENVWRVDESLN